MILTSLVLEFGVQPERPEGLPLEPTAKLAMDWYGNASSEVRENAVRLVAACYSHVGLNRIEKHLANLRHSQRETFEAEFQKVDNGEVATSASRGGSGRASAADDTVAYSQHGTVPMRASQPPPMPPSQRMTSGGVSGAAHAEAHEIWKASTAGMAEYDGGDDDDETTCQFCGHQDPTWTSETMDVHYWRECPMLTSCEHCKQVIEICQLRAHLREECESGAPALASARNLLPGRCPLCNANVGHGEEDDWREHLLVLGCPRNPRSVHRY